MDPIVNQWQEGRGFQNIESTGRGKVIRLNRLPNFFQGEKIDIVDMFHKFIMNTLVVRNDKDSESEGKMRSNPVDDDTLISNLVLLEKHVKYCMRSFTK